jgi:hypothetical protein
MAIRTNCKKLAAKSEPRFWASGWYVGHTKKSNHHLYKREEGHPMYPEAFFGDIFVIDEGLTICVSCRQFCRGYFLAPLQHLRLLLIVR